MRVLLWGDTVQETPCTISTAQRSERTPGMITHFSMQAASCHMYRYSAKPANLSAAPEDVSHVFINCFRNFSFHLFHISYLQRQLQIA